MVRVEVNAPYNPAEAEKVAVSPTLPPDLQQFLDQEIACGNYVTQDDVVVDALRLLKEERSDVITALHEALAEMEAGKAVPLRDAVAQQRSELGIPDDQ